MRFGAGFTSTSLSALATAAWPIGANAYSGIGPVPDVSLANVVGLGAGLLGMAYVGGRAMLARRRRPGEALEPNLDDLLPFIRIDGDNQTVICERPKYTVEGRKQVGKHEVRFSVVKFGGIDYASTPPEQLEAFRRARMAWQNALADAECAAMVVVDRHLLGVTMAREAENEWLQEVNTRWAEEFDNAFSNDLSVVLIDEGTGDLGAALRETMTILSDAKPRVVRHFDVQAFAPGERDVASEPDSELWLYIFDLVNAGLPVRRLLSPDDLPQSLKGSAFEFDEFTGTVGVTDGVRERFQKFVVLPKITRERVECSERVMRRMTMLDHEVTVYLMIRPREGEFSKTRLAARQANREIDLEGMTETMAADYKAMREGFTEGREAFTETEVIIRAQGATREAAGRAADAVVAAWTQDDNFRAAVATRTLINEWERRMPGAGYPLREMNLTRAAVSQWTPLEGTPRGMDRCWWGPHALRVVRTMNGGAYHWGVHEHAGDEALGNMMLLGKPGSGKSVATAWLITGALGYFPDMKVFCFDNMNGLSVPTKAFGGIVVTPGHDRFAPLQIEDTPANRVFLVQLLMDMAGADDFDGEKDRREAQEEIEHGLDLIMPLPREVRTLRKFIDQGVHKNSDVGRGLRAWVQGGAFAGWMDGDIDSLDFSRARWLTFDMTRLLSSQRVLSVYMAYVMHRIQTEIWDGPPQSHIVFIDEAPTMFNASKLMMDTGTYLARNIRKKKGAVFFAFQDAEGMGDAGDVIISSCAALGFFRNPGLNKKLHRDKFNLSEADIRFIADEDQTVSHIRHAMLFVHKTQRGQESTPLNLYLGALGELMALFRAGEDSVDLAEQCIREHGEKRWVRPYLELSKDR